jgi:hypothetical protein
MAAFIKYEPKKEPVFFEVSNLSQYGLDFDGSLYVDTL